MSEFKSLISKLQDKITASYESGVTLIEAERLAAEFLSAQISISTELASKSLDSRMRKSGLKSIRAAVYLESSSKGDKKPTEAALSATVDSHTVVIQEQDGLDTAEVEVDELQRLYSIFTNAHIYFRGVAKGNFSG